MKRVVKKTALGKLKVASLFANILGANRNKADEAANEEQQHPSDDEDDDVNDDVDLPDVEILRTFSPLIVHHQVFCRKSGTKLSPATSTHYGAVLFADISGFTRLANLLSVEQLQLHISKYFKMLFDCVERFNGDVLKICGDAIMIMWALENDTAKCTVEERAACALTASLCGREMILSCGTYTAVHGEQRISLSLHCGVGVADVQCYWVGKGGRWEFLISGDALAQIASTEPEAESGEIVISAEAYELVEQYVGATKTPGGNYLLSLSEIKSTGAATTGAYPPDDHRFIAGLSDHPTLNFDRQRAIATKYLGRYARAHPDLTDLLDKVDEDEVASGLQYYIHNSARSRLRHLGKDFQMAELREVVTLFVNITGLEEDFRLKRLDVIQNVMAVIIDSHKCFGGTLRQFVVDDKGCVAIGALGVPYHTYENNAQRGVEIAHLLQVKLQNMGKNCSIGLSSGDAFCGLVGSAHRREYAMMGSCINLAARLMGSCEPGMIVVDERVYEAASSTLHFEDMGTVKAKGYAEPVPIFSFLEPLLAPNSKLIELSNNPVTDYKEFTPIGRKSQLDSLLLGLRNYMDSSPGCQHQFHFLEGEEGIGKSELCKQVIMSAKAKGAKIIAALCLESYSKSDYRLMAQLLEKIMTVYEEEAMRNLKLPALVQADPTDAIGVVGGPHRSSISSMSKILEDDGGTGAGSFVNSTGPGAGTGGTTATMDHQQSTMDVNASWKRSRRFKEWAQNHLAFSLNPRGALQRTMIHGYPVMDIADLIATVFREIVPTVNPTIEKMKNKQKQLLVKTLLVRVLKVTFADRRRIFLLENLCKADIASATVISDFIGSSEIAFGIITYRGLSPESQNLEHEAFRGIRSCSYVVALPNLKERHAAELASAILGPQYRAFLTKEAVARMYARTQGNPGLLEALTLAILAELENGVTPTIENVRTHGQQSIVQKVDLLDPPLQLLLKTAAAIGMVLSVRALRHVYDALALKNDMVSSGCDVAYISQSRRESLRGESIVVSGTDVANRDAMGFGTVQLMLNLERLVDVGLFEPIEFKKMTQLAAVVRSEGVSLKESTTGIPSMHDSSPALLSLEGVDLEEVMDTPEISVQAIPWQDARGNKRRGWATVNWNNSKALKDGKHIVSVKPSGSMRGGYSAKAEVSASPSPVNVVGGTTTTTTTASGVGLGSGSGSGSRSSTSPLSRRKSTTKGDVALKKGHEYFRFTHPSVHSTAYALSLELDRVPVHAAMIEYLSNNFGRCPGLEETCLHHALLLKDVNAELKWLMKCSVTARDTYRHAMFIQRSTQLLSLLIGGECRMESELDHHAFVLCKSYKEKLNDDQPNLNMYTYEYERRKLPNWSLMEADPDDWLLTIGGVMRDMMCAMVKVGDVRMVEQLMVTSEELLDAVLRRAVNPVVPDEDDDGYNMLLTSYRQLVDSTLKRRSSAMIVLDEGLHPAESPSLPSLEVPSDPSARRHTHTSGKHPPMSGLFPPINGAAKPSPLVLTESGSSFLTGSANLVSASTPKLATKDMAKDMAKDTAKDTVNLSPRPHAAPTDTPVKPTASTLLTDFITAKRAAGALSFHTVATEEAVRSYHLPLLSNHIMHSLNSTLAGVNKWKATFIRSSFIHAYVRGQDALATMYMLRGNASKALEVLDDSINVINGACTAEEPCHVLQAICLPRLYSLRSCCYASEENSLAKRSLIQAELWLSKSKDDDIVRAIGQYQSCSRPSLPGLGDWHAADTGEWVLMVVVALRLCGQGMWDGALEEFEGAMAELKEINDKTTLFQVRILHAWALFMIGDISMFQNKMRAIKQYTDHVEEPLTSDAAGELLSFRFSLSCFYDASEILVSKFKAANTFSFGHVEVGSAGASSAVWGSAVGGSGVVGSPVDSPMGFAARSRASSSRSQRSSEHNLSSGKSSSRRSILQNNRTEFTTMNVYHKITEAFLVSRSRPKDLDVADMTDICLRISQRTPCHYLGGMYLFFAGMAAIATYEHHLVTSCEGLVPTKAIDLVPFISAIESEVASFADIYKALNDVLTTLELQSRKGRHPVLLYLYRALKVHACRMRGDIVEAMKYAIVDHRCAAETVPLGVACLKMEIALCRLSAHDDTKPVPEKRENLSTAIAIAKEAQVMFSVYEADIEISTLKRCVADCEDLVREMTPAFSWSRAESNMTARAYWLDLSCDDDSDNEGDG